MRRIERPGPFRQDYKREAKGRYRKTLDDVLIPLLETLAQDQPLAAIHRDHALTGNWNGHRECHVKPDLLLIYQKPDDDILILVALGSHSHLFS